MKNLRNYKKTIDSKREKFLEKEATTFKRIEVEVKQQTHHRYEVIREYAEGQKQKKQELLELHRKRNEE